MLSPPRFGYFPARKMTVGKLALPSGMLLDFLLRDCHSLLSSSDKREDAAFLLTIGSFLLTMELFYSQLTILAFFLTVEAFSLKILAFLLAIGAFLLTVGKCV